MEERRAAALVSLATVFCARREEQRQGEKKMGRGRKLGRAGFSPT